MTRLLTPAPRLENAVFPATLDHDGVSGYCQGRSYMADRMEGMKSNGMFDLEPHPPFCPGTERTFGGQYLKNIWVAAAGLDSWNPFHRELIARYQACAWQDRAERWRRLQNVTVYRIHRNFSCGCKRLEARLARYDKEYNICMGYAALWREWEKGKEQAS